MPGRMIGPLCILLTAAFISGKPDVPLPVHGIINQSIDLLCPVDQTGEELEIYWNYQPSFLAVFTNNQLKIRNDKYENRLETPDNGRTLRINNLRREDGGIYSVIIYITNKKVYETSYNLTVYDPVPSPAIQIKWKEISTARCNVTLHCSVPSNTSDLSYTWKYRQQGEYELYDKGSTIQISLKNDSWDTSFLCIVQNPADQKNISYNVRHICSHHDMFKKSNSGIRHHLLTILPILIVLLIIVGLFHVIWIYKRRKSVIRKPEDLDLNYAVLALQSRSCDNKRAEPKEEDQSEITVYSAVVLQDT